MGYILIEDFRYGQDTRKSAVTSPPGTLQQLTNAHITRGGEIEKAKKFVESHDMTGDSTFGFAALANNLYVFGSVASPSLPAGINYQRLQHPDGSTAMTKVIFTQVFNGKLYVIAQFTGGDIFHYYDGALVTDWGAGLVRSGMTNNSGIATHLAALIDADDAVSASAVGAVITVTASQAGTPFTISAEADDGGGTDNQTAVVATTTPSVAGVAEVLATAGFTITGGSASTAATGNVTLTGGAAGSIDSVTVNGVTITSGAVAFNTSLDQTATDLASNINAHTSSPEYTAAAVGSVVTISAAATQGATPNGFVVAANLTTITATTGNMAGGVTSAVTSVKVDGVEILSTAVPWVTSHSTTAANVAAQIDSYNSSPEYTADSNNAVVTVSGATGSGDDPNGRVLTVTVSGTVTAAISGTGAFAGGVDAVSGQAQVSTVTIGGTFQAGDQFTVYINDYPYGYLTRPTAKGTTLLTFKKKMYSGAADVLHFSGVNQPTLVSTEDTGAGFIEMSSEAPDFETITGLGSYFSNVAVFSEQTIQTWDMKADPSENAQAQIIENTGTFAPKSIKGLGDGTLLYLDSPGVRALKARDSSNFASMSEIGTAIDEDVSALLATLTSDQQAAAVATIEPKAKRYMLAVSTSVFVFSLFSGSKVSAWSVYNPELTFTDFAVASKILYGRAGDKIYKLGGAAGTTYVDAEDTVILTPFLDAKTPATPKEFFGIDVAVQGLWKVEIATDPERPDEFDHVMNVASVTFAQQKIPIAAESTHIAVKLTSLDANYGKISNLVIHFKGDNDPG